MQALSISGNSLLDITRIQRGNADYAAYVAREHDEEAHLC